MIVIVVILGSSKGLSVLVTVIVGAGLVTVIGGEGVMVVVENEVEAGRVVLKFRVVVDSRVVVCSKVDVVVEMEVTVVGCCKNCC